METRISFILLSIVMSTTLYVAKSCLLLGNQCVPHCPRNMHPYNTRCDRDTMSQRTCDEPEPYIIGFTCGWSRCDCNGELFLHEPTQICMDLTTCRLNQKEERSARKRRPGHISKKLRLKERQDLYTGHCPMLKFRFGKCYGDNTRQILREIKSKGLFNKPLQYRRGDHYELNKMPRLDAPKRDVYDGLQNRQPAYMTGYTGYVPGMHFRYGKSYGRAADDCMADFSDNQKDLRRKADFNRSFVRSRSAPKMETVHSRDEIRRDLNRFREINKYKENTISPEFPPIAGYTGHIPRIKGSEASLSQRYHCAAKRGLELIRMERDKRKEIHKADTNIRSILKEHDKKYSYWNWG